MKDAVCLLKMFEIQEGFTKKRFVSGKCFSLIYKSRSTKEAVYLLKMFEIQEGFAHEEVI